MTVSRTAFSRLSSAFRGSGRIDQAESPAVVDRYTGRLVEPHEGQVRMLASRARVLLNIASNRWGKSVAAIAMELAWRCYGRHPYKPVPLLASAWSGCPDFKFWTRTTLPIWDRYFPHKVVTSWSENERWAKIRRVDGGTCKLHFLSYDQTSQSVAGASVGFVHFDELPPERFYKEAIARTADVSGDIWLTVTPVDGLQYLEDELYYPALAGRRPDVEVLHGGLAEYDEALDRSDPESAGVGRVLVPWYTHEQVRAFAKLYTDPAERMVRVFGIYKRRTGGVYAAFDADVHVVDPFAVPREWEIFGGCDPGFHGFAATAEALSPSGARFVILEYFNQQGTHRQHVAEIWSRVRERLPWYGEPEDDPVMMGPFRAYDTPPLVGSRPWLVFYTDTANAQDILELNDHCRRHEWTDTAGHSRTGIPVVFTAIPQPGKNRDAGVKRIQGLLEPVKTRPTPAPWVSRPAPPAGEPLLYVFRDLHSEWIYRRPGSDASEEGEHMSGCRLTWEMQRYAWKKPTPNEPHPKGPDENSAGGAHGLASLRYSEMARYLPPQEPEKDPYEGMSERERRLAEALERAEREA